MKAIGIILKKELKRFFTDYRMLIGIILPGILIFLLYSVMGDFMGKSMGSEIKEFSMIVEKEPAEVKDVISIGLKDFTIHYLEEDWSKEDILKKIENQELDLYVVYPDNLLGGSSITNVPNVEMYYNSASDASLQAYTLYSEILNAF